MEHPIENIVAVVTGGASGIGLDIVDNIIRNGAKLVVILDINEELGNKAMKSIIERYGDNKAIFHKCDVTSDLEKVFEKITSSCDNIDLLVNNAGIADENCISKTLNINVTSLFEWSIKFYDYMRKDKNGNGGTILNIASLYGFRITPFLPTYHGSKFAVIGFTKSLGHEYNFKRTGVRVIAVCPGFTYTQLTSDLRTRNDDARDDFINEVGSNEWQGVEAVGKGVKEVYKTAYSGTVWVIRGSRPPEMV